MRYLSIVAVILGGGLILASQSAMAQVSYITNIGIGNKSMTVKIGERESHALFTSLDASWSVVKNRWFASISYEQSIKDGLQYYSEDIVQNGAKVGYANGIIIHSRADLSLTAGFQLFSGISLFAGVREGQTDSYLSALQKQSSVEGISSHGKIKSNGVFAGVSLSHRFAGGSSVSASVAMAKLNGSASLAEPYVDTTSFQYSSSFPSTVEGDALGFSYVLGWSNPLGERSAINLKAKLHRYHFEDNQVSLHGGVDLSYDENFTTGMIEFTYRI